MVQLSGTINCSCLWNRFVPNLSNYGHFFIHFVHLLCYLREEWVDFCHMWYRNKVPCVVAACTIVFGCMPNLSNYGNNCFQFYMFVVISQKKKQLILFIFSTVIHHNIYLMHVKYTLALCHNVAFMSIIS